MISLIMTFLLGLFCCSGVVNNRLDQQDKIIDSSGFLVFDEYSSIPPSKYIGANNPEFFYTYADFMNGEFMKTFVTECPSYTGLGFGYVNNADYYWATNSAIYQLVTGVASETKYSNVDLIRVHKYRVEDRTNFYEMYYFLTFIYQNTSVLEFQYIFEVPLVDKYTNDLGINCVYVDNTINTFNNLFFYYYENIGLQFCPFYEYIYVPYIDLHSSNSYQSGYQDGFIDGRVYGSDEGEARGYQSGYTAGFNEGSSIDSTASTIFTGILDVALIPVNVFLTIFNFEVFGINISGIVSGLLTLSVVIIIFRFLFGGNKDD